MTDVVRADTVVELLEQSRSVLVDEHGTERTCADILASGYKLAADLAAAGVQRGDRIAVQMQNSALYVDVLAAAAIAGYVVMSVNLRFAPALAESIIERSGARLTIRSASDLPTTMTPTSDAGSDLPTTTPTSDAGSDLPTTTPTSDAASDLRSPMTPTSDAGSELPTTTSTNDAASDRAATGDDRFVIFTTSGTTSAPKLVVHQQRSIAVHAADVATAFGYSPDSIVMVPLPLCGVFGFTVLWGALAGHSTVLMPTAFDADETGRLVQEHGVTSLHGSDDMFHRLLATDWDLSSIETSGYARFNSALDGIVERCQARGVPLSGLYGMSEVQALYAFRGATGLPMQERWRAAGELVSPLAERRVVDDELQLQGPSLFEGYLADGGAEIDHELTEANFDGPWFKTGDLAVEDGPRSFEYITRIGDVMRLGGFLVAPAEVEGAIMRLDEIDQAQVVAVGREQGARPVAFVILAPGAELDELAVIDHCASTLARFKCPVRVVAVDEFPVTDGPNGVKIQRTKLREMGADLLGQSA